MTPIFFNPDLNLDADEFKSVLPVNTNVAFDTLAPALADAERKYILPILGTALTTTLKQYYGTTSTPNTTYDTLIELIQAASIRAAYFDNFDILTVTLSDVGVQNPSGDSAAYRYQADAAKATLGQQAFEKIQELYDTLVSSTGITWQPEDTRYCSRNSHLIGNYRHLFDALEMDPDFRLYHRIRYMITNHEATNLPFHIGPAIAAKLINGTITDDVVLSFARRAVAYGVLGDSIMTLHGIITDEGITTRTIKAESTKPGTSVSTSDRNTRLRLQQTYRDISSAAYRSLVSYLMQHSSTYPDILSVRQSDLARTPKNSKKSKLFRV